MAVFISQFGSVPANLISNANFTISIVNEIFAAFPGRFRFTSGYRSPSQNTAANGVEGSFHLKALAADFVPINGSFPADEFSRIGAIVSKYNYEAIKHNAGSGLHYHIEPNPNFYSGQSQIFPVKDSQNNSPGNSQIFSPADSQCSNAALFVGLILLLVLIVD